MVVLLETTCLVERRSRRALLEARIFSSHFSGNLLKGFSLFAQPLEEVEQTLEEVGLQVGNLLLRAIIC